MPGPEEEEEIQKRDFTKLELKADHINRPLWVCADGRIFLETFSSLYKQAYDFLIAIAEPVCRPESMHEYNLTPHSLYAAVSVGLETETIITVLDRLSKTKLPKEIVDFIRDSTLNYGKVKLVLQKNRYFVESPYPEVLKKLLRDDVVARARIIVNEVWFPLLQKEQPEL
jgi:DNA excision repair protein ERCC-3